jgi:hypothetical protein
MEMQGLKPCVLMGKLKQHLSPGVSPDNDLLLAMFLVRLPPSMCETVGAGNHMTASAMVKAADALWDARGDHDPTIVAAKTLLLRPPRPYRCDRHNHTDAAATTLPLRPQRLTNGALTSLQMSPPFPP